MGGAKGSGLCSVTVLRSDLIAMPDIPPALAEAIREHATTVLIMAVGAPRSEIFVESYRAVLPPCWAFCVGQAVKIELGLVRRASRIGNRSGWNGFGG